MMRIIISIILYSVFVSSEEEQPACIGYSASFTYDLAALKGKQITTQDTDKDWTYQASICQATITCGTTSECGTTGICQEGKGLSFCVGSFLSVEGGLAGGVDGAKLNYGQGQSSRFGYIEVKCNPTATGDPVNLIAISAKTLDQPYIIKFEHASGCGKPGGKNKMSGGGVFLILLTVGIVVYLGVGMAYNAFMHGERGIQMIPQFEFWSQFHLLVVDGFRFVKNKFQAMRGLQEY